MKHILQKQIKIDRTLIDLRDHKNFPDITASPPRTLTFGNSDFWSDFEPRRNNTNNTLPTLILAMPCASQKTIKRTQFLAKLGQISPSCKQRASFCIFAHLCASLHDLWVSLSGFKCPISLGIHMQVEFQEGGLLQASRHRGHSG